MQYAIYLLMLFSLLAACVSREPEPATESFSHRDSTSEDSLTADATPIDTAPHEINWEAVDIRLAPGTLAYGLQCGRVEETRKRLGTLYGKQHITMDSIAVIFTELLVNDIIPYWYGTPWSFEGHTDTPGQGEIACGYFVSTTLLHVGVNLHRYKLAQQSPINEAKTLSLGDPIIILSDTSTKVIETIRDDFEDGIYFLGWESSHVGYLLKRKGEVFLIHSDYYSQSKVIIERAADSEVFSFYETFYIAPITTNKALIEKWLTQDD
ncbi:MAG TPA: hypothetical protein EYN69_02530 [Flavobacteriales bacterium]|nr:hypothetical protein [Flavobacteriales bacterium]